MTFTNNHLVNIKMIEIKEEDINLFWMINKKKDNDGKNRIREQIIYDILNNNINEDWYKNNKWNKIFYK